MFNGSVVNEVIGGDHVGILHLFSAPSDHTPNTTLQYQCFSFSPAGCTSINVQVNFINGIIPDTNPSRFPLTNIPHSTACTSLTTPTTNHDGMDSTSPSDEVTTLIATTLGEIQTTPPPSETTTPAIISLRPSHLPLNFIARIHQTIYDIHLSWEYLLQDMGSTLVFGFKVNWNTAERITASARASVLKVPGVDTFTYTIPTSTFNASQVLLVRVWAYNIYGDGPYSTIIIDSLYGKLILRKKNFF